MPRFTIQVKDARNSPWTEMYDKDVPDPYQWAKDTIAMFNATLKNKERPRELVGVHVLGESQAHNWTKTNLVTLTRGDRIFDTARCTRCGITGKRFGLAPSVTRDSAWRAKKYVLCGGIPLPPRTRNDKE